MKKFLKHNISIVLVIFLFSIMTIGYALYDETISFNGNITIKEPGIIEITNARIITNESSNLSSYENPTYEGMKINFKLTGTARQFYATYLIEITNNSYYDYTFTDFAFNPIIENSENTAKIKTTIINNTTEQIIGPGDIFLKGTVTTLKVKIELETENSGTTINVSGNASLSEDNSGSIIASITPTEGNLQGQNTIACFTLNVINTYSYIRIFNLSSSNENIYLVDKTGTELSNFNINANSTSNYEICTSIKSGSIFLTDKAYTTIILSSNGINNINIETLTLAVEPDVNATDKEIPEVGNITLKVSETNPTIGEAILNWNRIDTGGSSISNYYIILYNRHSKIICITVATKSIISTS